MNNTVPSINFTGLFTINTSPPKNPVNGDTYVDVASGGHYVYVSNRWWNMNSKSGGNPILKQITDDSFTCGTKELSIEIDRRIKELGLKSVKKSRRFNRAYYTVKDKTEIAIFLMYFSESIVQ